MLTRREIADVLAGFALFVLLPIVASAAEPPRAAVSYQRDLTRAARVVWGMDAPVALFGAQIHQESSWRIAARSPHAAGLAQFTPDTAEWIGSAYAAELAQPDPLNPAWAIRALVRYDRHLFDRITGKASPCDRWAFVLSAYNGGLGWVRRDEAMALAGGADPARWWGGVENFSPRAAWAIKENREYPRRILLQLQPVYWRWGGTVNCGGVQ